MEDGRDARVPGMPAPAAILAHRRRQAYNRTSGGRLVRRGRMADTRHFTTEPAPGERIWIDRPGALERAKREAPTAEVRFHAIDLIEKGYTVIPGCVPPRDREAAVTGFRSWCERRSEAVFKQRAEWGRLPRIVNLHLDVPELLPLFSKNEPALAVQDFCFGFRTSLYTSLFYETGSEQGLHRDVPYFRTEPENFFFGMWVALEDVDLDNGALLIVPGSHRLQSADPHALGAARRSRGLDIPPACAGSCGTSTRRRSRNAAGRHRSPHAHFKSSPAIPSCGTRSRSMAESPSPIRVERG